MIEFQIMRWPIFRRERIENKNNMKFKLSYALPVVDRIVIRIPLRFDGVSSGKLVSDACEFVKVELYETGILPGSVGDVISSFGFDKLKNSTLNCSTLLSLLAMILLSELTPDGLKVKMIL